MIPRALMKINNKPYELADSYSRFPVRRQALVSLDLADDNNPVYNSFMKKMDGKMGENIKYNRAGYNQKEYAFDFAVNTINLILAQYGKPNQNFLKWESSFSLPKSIFSKVEINKEKLTELVKEKSEYFGADLVGITSLNEKWVYEKDLVKPFVIKESDKSFESDEEFVISKKVNNAIVLGFAMNANLKEDSPKINASAASSIGYSRAAITVVALSEYIRALGYEAIPCVNDTALSIPLAIDAGLGQLGRNGILITPEFGPSVRLAKVLTDMPLKHDSPIDFGITEFCNNCLLCAKECPSQSISYNKPTFKPTCINNNSGVKKWYIDGISCLKFWQKNGGSCSTCINVCPFTKGFEASQCIECVKCETTNGCELQVNTHHRQKYGYLKIEKWGYQPKVLYPRRKGL
jgi:reductive dehalogenase